jgi:hypothetical protein
MVAEFKVWAETVRQSMGGLHLFLPLRDMGIDGVLHRLSDGVYTPVRVDGEWLVLEMQAGSAHHRRLDRYRTPLAALGRAAEALLAASDRGG